MVQLFPFRFVPHAPQNRRVDEFRWFSFTAGWIRPTGPTARANRARLPSRL